MEIRRLCCKQTMVYNAGQILLYTSKVLVVVAFFAGRSLSPKQSLIEFTGCSVHPCVPCGSRFSMLLNQSIFWFALGWGCERPKRTPTKTNIRSLQPAARRWQSLFFPEHQLAVFNLQIFDVIGQLELIAVFAALFLQYFMRTCISSSPGARGGASRFTFSWKDCALAAAASGASAGATGAGRFNTRTSVSIEIASVAKLIMRRSFTKTPPPFYGTRGK